MQVFTYFKGKFGIKSTLYLFSISFVYFILSAINFAEARLEWERFTNSGFWFNYAITIGLGLVILALTIPFKKDRLTRENLITDMIEQLRALHMYLIEKGIEDDFKKHLEKLNIKSKLELYREYLCYKKDKAKKSKVIDKWSGLLKETYKETFDAATLKIRIREVNINTIFNGIKTQGKSAKLHYTGVEGLVSRVLPIILYGVMLQALILLVALSFGKETTLDQWIMLASRLFLMTSYMGVALNFADYSINTVYFSCLENRISEVRSFLKVEKNIVVEIANNESYKYLVKNKTPNEEVANG